MSMEVYNPKTGELTKSSTPQSHVELAKKQLLPENATDLELEWFSAWCKARGLDPITGDVWAMRQSGKLVIQSTIQGKRSIAEQAGGVRSTRIEWTDDGATWVEAWCFEGPPSAARAIVETMDGRTFARTAMWRERSRKGGSWEGMPAHMLGKVAESDALSAAFPRVLGQVYTPDEFEQEPVRAQASPKKTPDELRAKWDETQQVLKELGLELMPEPGNVARAKELIAEAGQRIEAAVGGDRT